MQSTQPGEQWLSFNYSVQIDPVQDSQKRYNVIVLDQLLKGVNCILISNTFI